MTRVPVSPFRRDFLRQIAGTTTLPASWAAVSKSLEAAAQSEPDEARWRLVRELFPLKDGLIYLNAANICPASRPVLDRYVQFLRDFHSNPAFQNREKYKPMYESLRRKIASMLRASSADEIALTRNTSEGNNVIVNGIDLKPGDEVVITDHNHPSNNDAWKVRARRHGFVVKSLSVPVPAHNSSDLVASVERALTPSTKVVAITHVTSTTGILYPVRDIAELLKGRDVWLHVDGAQTFGVFDVNLQNMGCDSYTGSAHKWMMGPLEAGVLCVRTDRIPRIWPSIVTAGWSDSLAGARKFEVLGQRDDPRVAAFEAAVDFLQMVGIKNVEARSRQLAARAKRQLADIPGIQLKTNIEAGLSGAVVKFALRNRPTKEAYDTLWKKHNIALAMTASGDAEGLRYSPHIYNSLADIDQAVAAVRSLAS